MTRTIIKSWSNINRTTVTGRFDILYEFQTRFLNDSSIWSLLLMPYCAIKKCKTIANELLASCYYYNSKRAVLSFIYFEIYSFKNFFRWSSFHRQAIPVFKTRQYHKIDAASCTNDISCFGFVPTQLPYVVNVAMKARSQ